MTAAEVIADLLDEAERRARYEAVREAYASADASYREETEAWDSLTTISVPEGAASGLDVARREGRRRRDGA